VAREIDISFLGDKKLSRKLKRLPVNTRNTIIRKAFRSSNKRLRGALGRALSGEIVSPDTGRWLSSMKTAKIRATRSGGWYRMGIDMPERDELGIAAGDKGGYYPAFIEYGAPDRRFRSGAPNPLREFAPIRKTADAMSSVELKRIGDEIGKGILLLGGKP